LVKSSGRKRRRGGANPISFESLPKNIYILNDPSKKKSVLEKLGLNTSYGTYRVDGVVYDIYDATNKNLQNVSGLMGPISKGSYQNVFDNNFINTLTNISYALGQSANRNNNSDNGAGTGFNWGSLTQKKNNTLLGHNDKTIRATSSRKNLGNNSGNNGNKSGSNNSSNNSSTTGSTTGGATVLTIGGAIGSITAVENSRQRLNVLIKKIPDANTCTKLRKNLRILDKNYKSALNKKDFEKVYQQCVKNLEKALLKRTF
jgi:preprotein translocase subunit YajC